MASLTGNKIKDTYTSLLKVGDNGAIDSSAQALTDGAGNALGLTLTNTGIIVSTAKGTLIGTSSTGEVSSTLIADNAVDATRLNVSGNGTSGQYLISDGDGSFSWQTLSAGDITGVTAGDGLTGGGTSGDVTLTVNVDDSTIETNSDAIRIKDNGVTYAKMGAEFTTSATISASDVDWSAAAVHTKTLGANTTLTFSNVSTGMVIDLVIDGNYTLTLPASVKEISGTYDGTVTNLIQIVSTNGATEQWATISKEA